MFMCEAILHMHREYIGILISVCGLRKSVVDTVIPEINAVFY